MPIEGGNEQNAKRSSIQIQVAPDSLPSTLGAELRNEPKQRIHSQYRERLHGMKEIAIDVNDYINMFSEEYKQRQALTEILEYVIKETMELEPDAIQHLRLAQDIIVSKINSDLSVKH